MAEPRPQVVHFHDISPRASRPGPGLNVYTLVGRNAGSRQLEQRLVTIPPGASHVLAWQDPDEVIYVVEGEGQLWTMNERYRFELRPGSAAIVPYEGQSLLTNLSGSSMVVVSVLSPLSSGGVIHAEGMGEPVVTIHEDDQQNLPAGGDRHFRMLITPEHGARNVTQFVGFIDRSKAPFHTHTYEEAIYILSGEGMVHIEGLPEQPISPGTSIFLPPGTPHCLENRSDGALKLLGVFSPPGSPANMMETS